AGQHLHQACAVPHDLRLPQDAGTAFAWCDACRDAVRSPPAATPADPIGGYLPAQLRRTRLPRILGGYPTEVFVMFTGLRVTHDIQMRLMFFHRSEQFAAPAQLMLNLLAPHLLLRYRDTAARHVQMLLT